MAGAPANDVDAQLTHPLLAACRMFRSSVSPNIVRQLSGRGDTTIYKCSHQAVRRTPVFNGFDVARPAFGCGSFTSRI
jgi:hypothetical protein